jgi:hypothetical protein
MKQQHMHVYEQQSSYESERPLSHSYFDEQEKINPQRYRGIFILNSALQLVLIFLSLMYSLMAVSNTAILIMNFLFINIFYFLLVSFISNKLTRGRKILYICLVFILSLVLLFCSIFLIIPGSMSGLLLLWSIIILISFAIYGFFKLIPPISI